jgi:hypothetical protein
MRDYGVQRPELTTTVKDSRNFVGRAWDRGTDLMHMNLFQFTELVGDVVGSDTAKQWGEEGVLRNMIEAGRSPVEVESTDDVKDLETLGKYIVERVVENAPNFLADIGIAAGAASATALTGGVAAPAVYAAIGKSFTMRLGWRAAGKLGFTGSMYAQMTGESRHAQLEQGVDNPLLAFGTGAAKTGLEYYGLQSILKGFMPKGRITDAAGLAKHIGYQATLNTGIEGGTEFIQDLTDQLAIKMAKPGYEVDWNQLNESFWAGAAAGGGTSTTLSTIGGGASYLLNKSRVDDLNTNTVPEQEAALRAQLDEVANPDSARDTAIDPQGTFISQENAPKGVIVTTHEDGSTAATTDPAKAELHKEQGMGAAKELRGYQNSKEEILASGEEPKVVTRLDENGNEMSSELVIESNLEAAKAREQGEAKAGDRIIVRSISEIDLISERNEDIKAQLRDAKTATNAATSKGTKVDIDAIKDPAGPVLGEVKRAQYVDAPAEEQGKASIFDGKNRLRAAADLIRDIIEKRLSVDEIIYELGDQIQIDEDLVKAAGVALDRKATLQALVAKGVSEEALLEPNKGGRKRGDGYRSIESLLADPQLTDRNVEELARKYGVTPVAVRDFNMNSLISRVARKLRDPMLRRKLPDDLRAASFLFENNTEELVRDTTHVDPAEHQTRLAFIGKARPIGDPAAAIRAALDQYQSEGAKKQALVRIANAVGESVKSTDRAGAKKADLLVERDAAAAKIVQKIHNSYMGERAPTPTPAQDADTFVGPKQATEQQKATVDPNEVITWAKLVDAAERLLFRHWKTGKAIDAKAAVNNLTDKELAQLTTAFLSSVNDSVLETLEAAYEYDPTKLTAPLKPTKLTALLKPIIDSQRNPKAVKKEELIRSLRAAFRPFIESETTEETAVSDIAVEVGAETQQIVQDTAVLLKLLKAAHPEQELDPFEALADWIPQSPELNTDEARARIINAAQESSLQVRASKMIEALGEISKEAIEKLREGKSVAHVRKHLEGTLVGLPPERYDRSERDAALWAVPDIADGHSRANASGDSFASIPNVNEQEASNRSFLSRLMAAEVRFGATFLDYIFGAKSSKHSASTIRNTRLAKGHNLLHAIVTNLQTGKTEAITLDAVRLVQMGLRGMPGAESNRFSGDLVAGLYVAIDRMSPDEMTRIGYSRAYSTLTDQLSDDLVIAVEEGKNGPIITTLGDARKAEAELNAENPRWKRGQDKEEYFKKIDMLYDELAGIRAELAKSDDAEVQPAIDWITAQLEFQVDKEARETTAPSKLHGKPSAESPAEYLTRTKKERAAVRKFSNRALQINDEIVMLRNRSRAEQYIDVLERDDQDEKYQDHPDHAAQQPRSLDDDFNDAHGIVEDSRKNDADPESFETTEMATGVTTKTTPEPTREAAKPTGEAKSATKTDSRSKIVGLIKSAAQLGAIINFVHTNLGMRSNVVMLGSRELGRAQGRQAIGAEAAKKLQAKMANGESGAFLAQDGHSIIVINDSLSKGQQMAAAAHELGHALFNDMTQRSRNELEKGYREHFGVEPTNEVDPEKLHEWVADQVANYIAGRGRSTLAKESISFYWRSVPNVERIVARMVDKLMGLWREATRQLAQYEAAPLFVEYFERALGRRVIPEVNRKIPTAGVYAKATPDSEQIFNMPSQEAARKIRQAGAKAKQIHKTKWRPITAVVRSVYSRINDFSKALSAELYQPAQTSGPEAYEQVQNFLHSQMQSEMAKLEREIGMDAMKVAFGDLRAERDTENAKKVRAMIDKVNALMKGYAPTMHFRDNFIPEAFDHTAIEKQRGKFEAMLVEYDAFHAGEVASAVQDLLYANGITDYALAPGKAVSTHQSVNRILSKIPAQKLMDAGFLLDNPHAIMGHYIATGAKRSAWEYKFGGYTDQYRGDPVTVRFQLLEQAGIDTTGMGAAKAEAVAKKMKLEKDGLFYSPNHRAHQYIEQIRKEHGEAGVKAVKELLDSAMGRLGHDISPALRTSFDWISTWMNLTLLAFSGVASIPELAGSVVRSRGQLSLAEFKDALADLKQSREFATDIGVILTDGAEQMALETMGVQYSSPMQHKISQVFFKLNGQQFITKLSRTMAVSTGRQFLLSTAKRAANGDTAAAEELAMLHIDANTVNAWAEAGKPNDNLRVNAALNQFVFESSLKPSRFEATKWGNNPYFKLAWHLKQFFYSFGTVILGGIMRHTAQKYNRSIENGQHMLPAAAMASAPMLIAAMAFLPLAGLAEELREFIKHGPKGGRTDKMDSSRYLQLLSAKAGALGPFEIVASMYQAYEWNNSPIAATTPVTGFVETMLDADVSIEKKVRRITPFYSQGAFTWVFD